MRQEQASSISPNPEQRTLVEFLCERDVACPGCGYNLRGLGAGRCPECGWEIRLGIAESTKPSAAWLTCLISLSMSAGAGLFMLPIIAIAGSNLWSVQYVPQNAAVCFFVASIPLAAVALFGRRKYLRLRMAWQWTIAVAVTGIVLVAFSILLLQLMEILDH